MRWECTPPSLPCMVTPEKANACASAGSTQSRQEHHTSGLDDPFGDGRDALAVEGSTNKAVFRGLHRERALAPTLKAGQVVILDNLSAHKPARVRELIEGRGCELVYLPAYSPDCNPIEEAFSKIKGMLRRAAARTKDALVDVLGEALSAISAQDAQGYFEHAGYRSQAQLL